MDQPNGDAQADLIHALADPAAYPHPADSVQHIETHISHVFLAGDYAYKLKKPLRFAFVDYTTLERRRQMCEREYALNSRAAPELYLGVEPITRNADGRIVIGGDGEPLEWAVAMRRFGGDTLLSEMAAAGTLDANVIESLAAGVATFHDAAPPADPTGSHGGGARVTGEELHSSLDDLDASPLFDAARLQALRKVLDAALTEHAGLLDARLHDGAVRHVHGDLHLRNACWIDGRAVLFDGIEFNDRLAVIDTLFDLAFLLMDLIARDRADLANVALNRYLAARWDIAGLPLLPLYLSTRALIRAKVAAARHAQGDTAAGAEAENYLALAERLMQPAPGVVVAIGGLSGTGKSTVARAIAPTLGRAPGAVWLRSDVLRKQLAGVDIYEHLSADHYTPEWSTRVYDEIHDRTRAVASVGQAVIADAVYARPHERAAIAAATADAGMRFIGIWLDAPLEVREARVGSRGKDASDADAAVARRQADYALGEMEWRVVDASGSPIATVNNVRSTLDSV